MGSHKLLIATCLVLGHGAALTINSIATTTAITSSSAALIPTTSPVTSVLAVASSTANVSAASASPTCPNVLSNPSFDQSVEGWTYAASFQLLAGGVAVETDGDGVDSGGYAQVSGYWTSAFQIQQTLSNLAVGVPYTVSAYWRMIVPPGSDYICSFYLYGDLYSRVSFASIDRASVRTSGSIPWRRLQGTWQPSATTATLTLLLQCYQSPSNLENLIVQFDDVQMIAESCPAATSSSVVVSSTPIHSSSSAVAHSSPTSSLNVVASSSRPLIPSSSSVFRSSSSFSQIAVSVPTPSGSRVPPAASGSIIVASPNSNRPTSRPARPVSSVHPGSSQTPSSTINPGALETDTAFPERNQYTTSTILTTRTATVTACPSAVTDCPASKKTTYLTTETIVVSTTVCPITEAGGVRPTATVTGLSGATETNKAHLTEAQMTTSTVWSTRTSTITACPSTVLNCPASQKTTHVTTETVLVSTTVCPITAAERAPTATGSASRAGETGTVALGSSGSAGSAGSADSADSAASSSSGFSYFESSSSGSSSSGSSSAKSPAPLDSTSTKSASDVRPLGKSTETTILVTQTIYTTITSTVTHKSETTLTTETSPIATTIYPVTSTITLHPDLSQPTAPAAAQNPASPSYTTYTLVAVTTASVSPVQDAAGSASTGLPQGSDATENSRVSGPSGQASGSWTLSGVPSSTVGMAGETSSSSAGVSSAVYTGSGSVTAGAASALFTGGANINSFSFTGLVCGAVLGIVIVWM